MAKVSRVGNIDRKQRKVRMNEQLKQGQQLLKQGQQLSPNNDLELKPIEFQYDPCKQYADSVAIGNPVLQCEYCAAS